MVNLQRKQQVNGQCETEFRNKQNLRNPPFKAMVHCAGKGRLTYGLPPTPGDLKWSGDIRKRPPTKGRWHFNSNRKIDDTLDNKDGMSWIDKTFVKSKDKAGWSVVHIKYFYDSLGFRQSWCASWCDISQQWVMGELAALTKCIVIHHVPCGSYINE